MYNLSISVVIPNYNGVKLFPETLPSLFSALASSNSVYEVIIVDDCSTDNSVEHLKKNYPQVTLLENDRNQGFSPTINKGIFSARHELVFLLNSDVKLTEGYFHPLYKYFDRKDTFGVMGRIIDWEGDTIQDGAKFPEVQRFKLKTSLNYIPKETSGSFYPSLYLSGANALVNRKKLLLLGGFNEMFAPFYIEDVDLSIRAWRNGWSCYYEHEAICRHRTSSSIKNKDQKRYISTIYNRNKLYLHAIHFNGILLLGWMIQTFLELLLRILMLRFDYLKSFWLFLKDLNKVIIARNQVNVKADIKPTSLSKVISTIKGYIYLEKVILFRR